MLKNSSHGKSQKKALAIFIHGLSRNDITWINKKGNSSAYILYWDNEIKKKFDTATSPYFSRFYSLTP